ncbi:CheR family methyltransferase [Chryseosolibacter indicus]|uniref:Protein-glutamate O-methyltransferase CheR n=1 Tax=Chryseosolibacter indicus TaxID=2782351 RepID=A0ABS5VPT3_9BACT|nr:protein-glutamate O-methyltransferase CheR [Chryseosolibacter indicus]MBT1702802.1 protein-glutamate O-methyltransferase CheR [Chryseosolibacter indicus]
MQDIDIADLKRISEVIYQKYNYDFRNYAMSSFKRRVLRIMELKKLNVETLLKKFNDSPMFINEFLDELTVNVTEMFRDPSFWRVMREEIIPAILLNHRQFKIWHAGCSSGEEVMTMCIMLKEMGILHDVSIIATDLDVNILERAKSATYPIKNMELNEKNYIRFQGSAPTLKDYYKEENGYAVFNKDLLTNVSFRKHDLVLGDIFNKFDLILCRNVMIYFNQSLQNDVLKKFHESLFKYGYLAIGSKESLIWCDYANRFIVVNNEEKIYKKIKD